MTSSGMAAIFLAITNICKAGDHFIASASLYGGTETLFRHTLPRFGIQATFIPEITPEKVREAVRPETRLVFMETLGNPKGDVPDIAAVADAAHRFGLPLFVDNTFCPIICKVFRHGADVCIHSLTKWIGGHGNSIGGIIIDGGSFDWGCGRFPEFTTPDDSYHGIKYWERFKEVPGMGNVAFVLKARLQGMRNMGMCPSPMNAFLILQGLETLPLRIRAQCENALSLAKWLRAHPGVAWVNYTGLDEHPSHAAAARYLEGGYGAVLGFGIKGGCEAAKRLIDALSLTSHLANVGDAKTLAIHPASTTHRQLAPEAQASCGITPEFIRVSVGLEDIDDLKTDFSRAIEKALP
jgi:O-acetylhomoserine (thiol)-lyase